MSINAYRVVKIQEKVPSTFNLWHDDKLMQFLDEEYHFYEDLNSENKGLATLPVEALEKALLSLSLDRDLIASLQDDIDAARASGELYVQYYCH